MTKRRKTVSSTGGSTGEPMPFVFDDEAAQRRAAATYRGYGWAGVEPGAKRLELWGTDLASPPLIRRMKKTLVNAVKRNHTLSCFNLTPDRMRSYANMLNRYQPHVLVAYSQALFEFSRYLEAEHITPFSPATIVVGAEPIYDFQRALIERVFRTPVFETYGCRELLLIAAECERREGLHLSSEHLIVEILDDQGHPAADGEEGEVVITDLTNRAMPLIRYANGDRALAGFQQCSCGRGLPLLRKLRGRTVDTITTPDGRRINGVFFPHLIKDFPIIRQFQVIQLASDSLTLNFVADDELPSKEQQALLGKIQHMMGPAMRVETKRVPEITRTSSGKLRPVVSLAGR
jgi:phenylacetate-CoA ligase